jgi:DNA invertase Pin-like site-specific DNA recombinase
MSSSSRAVRHPFYNDLRAQASVRARVYFTRSNQRTSIMKSLAIYMRISSASQNLRGQEAELERWSQSQDTPVRWFSDVASGSTMQRAGWQKLKEAVDVGEISAITVWRLDRLGRTVSGLVNLFEDLRRRNVGLISLRDGFDLETPSGRLMAHILASISVFESELRGERQRIGIEAAKARGQKWGGSAAGRRLRATNEKVEVVHQLKAEGKAVSAIARAVSLSRPTIYRILAELGRQ